MPMWAIVCARERSSPDGEISGSLSRAVHALKDWALTRIRATSHLARDAARVQLVN